MSKKDKSKAEKLCENLKNIKNTSCDYVKDSIEIVNEIAKQLVDLKLDFDDALFKLINEKIKVVNIHPDIKNEFANMSKEDIEACQEDACKAIFKELVEYRGEIKKCKIAKRMKIEFDGETFLSIASILIAIILLGLTILSICTEDYVFWSGGENGFWNMNENADSIGAFVSGIIMLIVGTIYIIHLIRGKKSEEYQDAKTTLKDAGIKVKAISIIFFGGHNVKHITKNSTRRDFKIKNSTVIIDSYNNASEEK